MCERQQRGAMIAAISRIVKKGDVWIVPSQSGKGKYTVSPNEPEPYCSCQDHETNGGVCKHIFAVRYVMKREESDDDTGTVVSPELPIEVTTKRQTYPQQWKAYNAAQVNEKRHFQDLLRDLCSSVATPAQVGKGRPLLPLCDAIFSAVFKVYSTVSARRFMTDLTEAHASGHIGKLPCYNSIFNYLENPELTPILTDLIVKASVPLRALETTIAVDGSGFALSRFDRWYDHKYGKVRSEHQWVKANIAVGVNTQVVTAIEMADQAANDTPFLPALVDKTAENFDIKEVLADKGYCSIVNVEKILSVGADPFVMFRKDVTGWSGGLFAKAYHFFAIYRQEFLQSYHQRSNVESAFSMIKRKFGDSVRSKTETAAKNEVLCKVVCHNICCLISAMYELGIEPKLLAV
jgi:transposase